MEIENNSFLDFNTNSNGGTGKYEVPKKTGNFEDPQTDSSQFDMMTEINNDGDLIVNFEVNVPVNHPIMNQKVEDLEKNA